MGRGKDLTSDQRVAIQDAVKNGRNAERIFKEKPGIDSPTPLQRAVQTTKEEGDFARRKVERNSNKRTAALAEKERANVVGCRRGT